MPIVEGYGLTETSPVLTFNDIRNNELKIGTVGKPIQGVEIKIAEDGEILCKGPNIMKGYFKDPELTENAMSGEFFHTGDIGIIDDDGFLKITDRKKQIFKTLSWFFVAATTTSSSWLISKASTSAAAATTLPENEEDAGDV